MSEHEELARELNDIAADFADAGINLHTAEKCQEAAAAIRKLEGDLKAVLDRESATQARHDQRVAELEAERDEARAERDAARTFIDKIKEVGNAAVPVR